MDMYQNLLRKCLWFLWKCQRQNSDHLYIFQAEKAVVGCLGEGTSCVTAGPQPGWISCAQYSKMHEGVAWQWIVNQSSCFICFLMWNSLKRLYKERRVTQAYTLILITFCWFAWNSSKVLPVLHWYSFQNEQVPILFIDKSLISPTRIQQAPSLQ